ncbi:hypothetical protein AB0O32_39225 [Streptomyces rubiginosohelvolus]|uniref:hypothetical protein n=1 Tax=Streptomyces rubiginosohelvolus TaxID=67362 RepID=UPI0034159E26
MAARADTAFWGTLATQARVAQTLTALRRRETLDRVAGHLMVAPTAHLRPRAERAAFLSRFACVAESTIDLGRSCVIDLADLPCGGDSYAHLLRRVGVAAPSGWNTGRRTGGVVGA